MSNSKYSETEKILSGWGNYPKVKSRIFPISTKKITSIDSKSIIPRGLGRSYGDSALNLAVVDITSLDRFLFFDEEI